MITAYPTLIVHLWQSTLFATVTGLLTLLLKRNQARTRYWVWLAALVKFLIPFGLLVSLGAHLGPRGWTPKASAIVEPTISFVMGDVGQSTLTTPLATPQTTNDRLPALLFSVWACGFLVILSRWLLRWMQVRADVRSGSRLSIEIGIPVVSSPVLREPGVFGILHPVLLLPEGIAEHLSKAEWEAILAHEVCHARCYDNLTAAIYMLVETIFWFHPLVWWMGKRLVAERERACDEEVLRLGSEPEVYAEGILKVCELYLESPLECVAGVTGSNLRRRIRAIMTYRGTERMKMGKKLLLLVAGILAAAGPLVVGILNTPSIRAQSAATQRTATSSPTTVAQSGDATMPKFDVVSVKLTSPDSGAEHSSEHTNPGHLRMSGSMHRFIIRAYGITDKQIGGEPDWFRTNLYSIEAVTSTPASPDQMMLMLRSVLTDRFQLQLRQEERDSPVYVLEVAVGGPKFKELKSGEVPSQEKAPPGIFAQTFTSINVLVNSLNGVFGGRLTVDLPVVDRTGLSGNYAIHLRTEIEEQTSDGGRSTLQFPNLFQDIQSELGLKLVNERVKMPYFVVEHASLPTPN